MWVAGCSDQCLLAEGHKLRPMHIAVPCMRNHLNLCIAPVCCTMSLALGRLMSATPLEVMFDQGLLAFLNTSRCYMAYTLMINQLNYKYFFVRSGHCLHPAEACQQQQLLLFGGSHHLVRM